MKNRIKLFGIIVMLAIIGLAMIACDLDLDNTIPAELVGQWYHPVTDSLVITITADGKLTRVNVTYNVSVSGKTITVTEIADSSSKGTFDYSISGNIMTLSNGTGISSNWPLNQPTLVKK